MPVLVLGLVAALVWLLVAPHHRGESGRAVLVVIVAVALGAVVIVAALYGILRALVAIGGRRW